MLFSLQKKGRRKRQNAGKYIAPFKIRNRKNACNIQKKDTRRHILFIGLARVNMHLYAENVRLYSRYAAVFSPQKTGKGGYRLSCGTGASVRPDAYMRANIFIHFLSGFWPAPPVGFCVKKMSEVKIFIWQTANCRVYYIQQKCKVIAFLKASFRMLSLFRINEGEFLFTSGICPMSGSPMRRWKKDIRR